MKEKYGFVYMWYDSARSKQNGPDKVFRYYIGYHWGDIDDGYICSSNWMRDAYRRRPQDFGNRRILKTNISTKEETIAEEHRWLQMIKKEELGEKYYNLKNCKFPMMIGNQKEDSRKRISDSTIGKPKSDEHKAHMRKPKSDEHCKNISVSRQGMYFSEDHKENLSKAQLERFKDGMPLETRKRMGDSRKGRIPWNKDLILSDQIRDNMSKARKGQIPWNKGLTKKKE